MMTQKIIRVLLADDQLIAREGFRKILESEKEVQIAGEAITALEVPRKVDESSPDIVLMDLKWFGDETAGWSAIKDIKRKHPEVKVIAVTAYENLVKDARYAGADAVLLKTFTKDELVSLVRELAAREFAPVIQELIDDNVEKLTSRELDVLRLVADGRRDKEIAEILTISSATVKNHVKSILGKLNATNRTQAAKLAQDKRLIR
jgi:DNA-binding NarL/FixJ family response regulator